MSILRCILAGIPIVALACGEDAVTPTVTTSIEGHYALTWTADRAATAVQVVPGIAIVVGDCGNGAGPPNATFTFADSSALAIQREPQGYALTIIGTVTDCAGDTSRHFDVAVGEYVMVEGAWMTLTGDLTHPNFEGQVAATTDSSVMIVLRPGQPGLGYPLAGVDRMCFTGP